MTKAKEKHYLTLIEAAEFLGLSKSYLYQLTHKRQIPFYKNGGRRIAFDMEQLQIWRESRICYVPSQEEHTAKAVAHCSASPLFKTR